MDIRSILINKLPKDKKRILLLDADDSRVIEAFKKLKSMNIEPILFSEELIKEYKEKYGQRLIELYLERRRGKETSEQAIEAIKDPNTVAMLLLQLNEVDGVVGGANAPTANILRPAFKIVWPKPGIKTISSLMILEKGNEMYVFADVAVKEQPTSDELSDIALNASTFSKSIAIDPLVAFLSFSTTGSAPHENSQKVSDATRLFNSKWSGVPAIGEVQFDAAFDLEVRKNKYMGECYSDRANIFIFPSLDAANIGYKIAQRLGGFKAIGPIIAGINKPVNDLSRGASIEEIIDVALITAIQAGDEC